MRCRANTFFVNGQIGICGQEGNDNGLCYYHDKMSKGLIEPDNQRRAQTVDEVTGNGRTIWTWRNK